MTIPKIGHESPRRIKLAGAGCHRSGLMLPSAGFIPIGRIDYVLETLYSTRPLLGTQFALSSNPRPRCDPNAADRFCYEMREIPRRPALRYGHALSSCKTDV